MDITKIQVTDKPWGKKWPVFRSQHCDIWAIDVVAGGYCSIHMHQFKSNYFYVQSGCLNVHFADGCSERIATLRAGDSIDLDRKVPHQFEALGPTVGIEAYYDKAYCNPSDIYRWSKGGVGDAEGFATWLSRQVIRGNGDSEKGVPSVLKDACRNCNCITKSEPIAFSTGHGCSSPGFIVLRHFDPFSDCSIDSILSQHELEGSPVVLDPTRGEPVYCWSVDREISGNDECWVLLGPFSSQEHCTELERRAFACSIGGVLLPELAAYALMANGAQPYSDG